MLRILFNWMRLPEPHGLTTGPDVQAQWLEEHQVLPMQGFHSSTFSCRLYIVLKDIMYTEPKIGHWSCCLLPHRTLSSLCLYAARMLAHHSVSTIIQLNWSYSREGPFINNEWVNLSLAGTKNKEWMEHLTLTFLSSALFCEAISLLLTIAEMYWSETRESMLSYCKCTLIFSLFLFMCSHMFHCCLMEWFGFFIFQKYVGGVFKLCM